MADKKRRGGPRTGMTAQEREQELVTILRMRRAGADYNAIGKHFGINPSTAYQKVRKAIQDMPKEEASELRALEAAKLDFAETHLQTGIKAGDTKSITALVRLSESRRKLLGLDMPEQHEVKITREEESLADQLAAALTEKIKREQGITE